MTERHDDELGKLLKAARPEPREGWQERTLTRMRGAAEPRWGWRLRWVPTALGTALVVAALALLPESAAGPSDAMPNSLSGRGAYSAEAIDGSRDWVRGRPMHTLPETLRPYVERAESFVRSEHWDDPRMLMAAGILMAEYEGDLSLLKEAAEQGGGAEWAAYAGAAVRAVPEYASLALWRADPRDPESMREVREEVAATGLPLALTAEEAEPALEVLREWERADPDNGMPAALAIYYLHGLGREEDALESWERAGAQPRANLRVQETVWAMQRLLVSMGKSEWDSASHGFSLGYEVRHAAETMARHCARIAMYEGRRAAVEGRHEDAFAWWHATIALGRGLQESSDTAIEVLQGIAIHGVGAWDIWRWRPDQETGLAGGPLEGGRLYQGPAYQEFVNRYGEEAARDVRDSLVRAKLRSMMMKGYYSRDVMPRLDEHLRAGAFRGASRWFGILLVVFLLVWGGVSLTGRRVADEATRLSRWWARATALSCLMPIAVVAVVMVSPASELLFGSAGEAVGLAAIALSLLSPVFVPLIIVRWTRPGEARIRTVWRGNLRRVLPPVIALCAAVSLCAGIAGTRTEKAWVRDWQSRTEMERVVEVIGPEWDDPPIPADAWRNEPPPEVEGG